MKNVVASDLMKQCERFSQLIKRVEEKQKIDFVEKTQQEMQKKVVSLCWFIGEKKQDINLPQLIPHGTSCDSSAMKTEDSDEQKTLRFNFKEIESMLIDQEQLLKVSKFSTKMVIFEEIPHQLNYRQFIKFLDSLKRRPAISNLHFCFYNSHYSVIVNFETKNDMEMFVTSYEKRLRNFEMFFGQRVSLSFLQLREQNQEKSLQSQFYQKIFKKQKKMVYYGDNFVGLIVRNLPQSVQGAEILDLFKSAGFECQLRQEAKFKKQHFCLFTFKNIEMALKALFFIQKKSLNLEQEDIKVNIHSQSNFKRSEVGCGIFFNEQENLEYQKIMDQLHNEEISSKIESHRQEREIKSENEGTINFDSPEQKSPPRQNHFKHYNRFRNRNFRNNRYQKRYRKW